MKNPTSLSSFLVSVLIIFFAAVSSPNWEGTKSNATLSWDVNGYYLYLPAFLIHGGEGTLAFKDEMMEKYAPIPVFFNAYPVDNGNYIIKYSVGLSILYLPSFLVGHFIAWAGDYPMDGFSRPYQTTIHIGSILFALIGLWYCRRNLLRFFDDKVTAITLLAIALGTNFFIYSSLDAALTHGYLFALISFLIHATIEWYRQPNYKHSIGIGVCIGLAALTRPTEIIIVLIPLLWGIDNVEVLKSRLVLWQKHLPKLLLTGVIIGAIGSIQLIYWKIYSGNWIEYSYQDQGFSWLRPHIWDFTFSYRKGWLLYTPMMIFGLIGFYFLFKKYRTIFWVTLAYFLVHFYISSAWDIWWYGGGFGQRTMVQSYAMLAFPLAAFMGFVLQKKWLSYSTIAVVVFFIWLNLLQTWQSHQPYFFETEYMTKAYYWRIFGKTKNIPENRFLLDDIDADFLGERKEVAVILQEDFENIKDTIDLTTKFAKSGKKSIYVDSNKAFSHVITIEKTPEMERKNWVRIKGSFYMPVKVWESWKMPQFSLRIDNNNQIVGIQAIKPFRVMESHQWEDIWFDVKLSDYEFDTLKVYLFSGKESSPMYMDDLEIEVYNE